MYRIIRQALVNELEVLRTEADELAAKDPPSFENGCVLETFAPGDDELWREKPEAYFARRKGDLRELLLKTLPALVDYKYLFNEHYVVKPASSDITFRWHTDRAEQLAAVSSDVDYVSLWIALDDCDETNGCLEVREGPLLCKAGDVVVLDSRCEHRSGPNTNAAPRRAFYAQYSAEPIRVGPSLLRLALPCQEPNPFDLAATYLKSIDTEIATKAVTAAALTKSEDWSLAAEAWTEILDWCWSQLHDPKRHWSEAPVECRRA